MSDKITFTNKQGENASEIFAQVKELSISINQPLPFIIEKEISPLDIRARLKDFGRGEKFYFRTRDNRNELGAFRAAFSASPEKAEEILKLSPQDNLFFLIALRFTKSKKKDDVWDEFPDGLCFVPEIMIRRLDNKYVMQYCMVIDSKIEPEELNKYGKNYEDLSATEKSSHSDNVPDLEHNQYLPDKEAWNRIISKCLNAINAGDLKKIVMSRRIDYRAVSPINPFDLLISLDNNQKNNYAMLYQGKNGKSFISISPERLYRRENEKISVDALSSTVDRGETAEDDAKLERLLFDDAKLQREHQAVIDGVEKSLAALCNHPIKIDPPKVLKLSRIQHLLARITGQLKNDVGDRKIIETLPPTPAVGGTPREVAADMISQLEPFDRGWYAGPIGYWGKHESEIMVGIRSMAIEGERAHVYVGSGIVEGSNPDGEWRETESKNVMNSLIARTDVKI
ncbi:MAG: isochorismate synthase [candidate division Zixibacteria bacterium]